MHFLYIFIFVIAPGFLNPAYAACTDPDGVPGEVVYNDTHDSFQGCTTRGWAMFHAPASASAAPDCSNIGETCSDGTIYAGEYDGHSIFVAADDAPTKMEWGSYGSVSGMELCPFPSATTDSCRTGWENTQYLNSHATTFPAAEYCAGLSAHGYDTGWYLPSYRELQRILLGIKQGEPEGTHNFMHEDYWTSSEEDAENAWHMTFNAGGGGVFLTFLKQYVPMRVRCVRQ